MRPRHCCRGRRWGDGLSGDPMGCFNEAAALLPRKAGAAAGRPGGLLLGFNEAAALLPRKACFRHLHGQP